MHDEMMQRLVITFIYLFINPPLIIPQASETVSVSGETSVAGP